MTCENGVEIPVRDRIAYLERTLAVIRDVVISATEDNWQGKFNVIAQQCDWALDGRDGITTREEILEQLGDEEETVYTVRRSGFSFEATVREPCTIRVELGAPHANGRDTGRQPAQAADVAATTQSGSAEP